MASNLSTPRHDDHWTRTWDTCVWREDGQWNVMYLATDYRQHNQERWWQTHNVLIWQRGPDYNLATMETVSAIPPPEGYIWTAPSAFQCDGETIIAAGVNKDGPQPDQRLYFFRPEAPEAPVGRPPQPLLQYGYRGTQAWRDGQVLQIAPDRWWLYVSTGGFRWGCNPNVVLFEADHPLGKWSCLGPMIDPVITQLYSEIERPQLYPVKDRWSLWWSCWPSRHFFDTNESVAQHTWASTLSSDVPVIDALAGFVEGGGVYALQVYADDPRYLSAWRWTDRASFAGEVVLFKDEDFMQDLAKRVYRASSRSNMLLKLPK